MTVSARTTADGAASLDNRVIAALLRNVAAAMTIQGEQRHRFQILAYQRAADAIEGHPEQIEDELREEGHLENIPGVGKGIEGHLRELFATGHVAHWDETLAGVPAAVFALTAVPGIGPKRAYALVTGLNLASPRAAVDDLEAAGQAGRVASLPGFGERSQEDILRAIREYRSHVGKAKRMLLPFAAEIADHLIGYLKGSSAVLDAYPLGSLRRMKETIGDIDIAVATRDPAAVIERLIAYPGRLRTIERGDVSASILLRGGTHIDVMTQPPDGFGALLQHFTGSRNHNIHLRELAQRAGKSLSEYGIRDVASDHLTQYATEGEFYRAIGLGWIPPEMREDTGEIELAASNALPDLVSLGAIKGDLHLHSSFPIEPSHDLGKDPMPAMAARARTLGYDYIGFAEHNPSVAGHTRSQVHTLLESRAEAIERLRTSSRGLHIASLLEIDILPNGKLAIDDAALDYLDAAIVSIHSRFGMERDDMTKRVLSGLAHPKARILAHPTGRLLNQRPGFDLDWDRIFDFVRANDKALEINSWPSRLDLPDTLVREAVQSGVRLSIDTDSHAVAHMDLMRYGVAVARRGWATGSSIVNTQPWEAFRAWLCD